MTTDPTYLATIDPADADLEALAALVVEESRRLAGMLPDALASQWSASPIPKPRDDTTERSKGAPSDPTAAVALDGRRLRLRAQVIESERVLRDAAIAVVGVRRGLERTLGAWHGEDGES